MNKWLTQWIKFNKNDVSSGRYRFFCHQSDYPTKEHLSHIDIIIGKV